MEQEEKENIEEDAVIYIRLSKDDVNNPSLSPKHQKEMCEQKIKRDKNRLVKIYEDINKTGTNIFRSGLQDLMNDARKKLFSLGYIKDYSRFSRHLIDQESMIEELGKLGIKIISCDGVKDKKTRQITGLTNEWYIDKCREDTKRLHQMMIKKNQPINKPPMGYKLNKKEKVFIIDNKNAEVVKKIFELRIQQKNLQQIKDELKLKMSVMGIYNLVRNKTYIGLLCYRHEYYDGLHKPIIQESLFNEVQKINEANKKNVTPKIS